MAKNGNYCTLLKSAFAVPSFFPSPFVWSGKKTRTQVKPQNDTLPFNLRNYYGMGRWPSREQTVRLTDCNM